MTSEEAVARLAAESKRYYDGGNPMNSSYKEQYNSIVLTLSLIFLFYFSLLGDALANSIKGFSFYFSILF